MNRLTSRRSYAYLVATVAALLALGVGTAAHATSTADRGPIAKVAKKKSNRHAGTYRGTTEEGGTVSFTITRKGLVVGFTMPNVPVQCRVYQPPGNPGEPPPPYPGPPFTFAAPTMKLIKGPEGGPQFFYEDPPDSSRAFQGIHVDGKGAPGGMKGNAAMISWNGPETQSGTVQCNTKYVDWSASKVGGRK